jgi:RNase P/RNase MRP subunit POP5
MKEYSQKTKTLEETNKKLLYIRYNVTSRTELTREQLEEAIRFYSDGIMYDI